MAVLGFGMRLAMTHNEAMKHLKIISSLVAVPITVIGYLSGLSLIPTVLIAATTSTSIAVITLWIRAATERGKNE